MTALEQLAGFIAEQKVDARARDAVRLHVADTIGAWLAAVTTEEGRALLAYDGGGLGAPIDRIAVNVGLARLSEIDDIHLAAMITPGGIVVPAALTIAAALPQTAPGEVEAAVLAGYEAMIRLGVAINGPSALYRGIWPSYFAAPFGVAAVASRLLGLDAAQTAHALAIALTMASPATGHHPAATTARWLALGQGAGRGLQAALAAQAGFTADVKLAENDVLKNAYNLATNAALLGDGFSEPAILQTSFKPWCAARQTMAATQALKEILAAGVPPDAIARIGVSVLPPHLKMIDHGVTAADRASHLTSVTYQMALAALAPEAAYALSPAAAAPLSPELAAFMARIQVRADDALLRAGYPARWAAHVTVTARTGRRQHAVADVPGDPARPFGEAEVRDKFVRVLAPLMDAARAEAMFATALAAPERPSDMLETLRQVFAAALKA